MFTLENILEAHSKVKSGADFPAYVQSLISLGVKGYQVNVANGKAIYYSQEGSILEGPPKYDTLTMAENAQKTQFENDLKAHQNGQTDYMTFCRDCAKSGIYGWKLDFGSMTCTYFDQNEALVWTETIPSA